MTDNITLPRSVVEQTLDAMTDTALGAKVFGPKVRSSLNALRAALDHPKNHVPDAGNMAPAGWKLVPVDPTQGMIEAGKDAHYEAEKRIQDPGSWEQGGFAKRAVRATHVFQAMLAAAPHPPTVKECLTVEQQQVEQQPALVVAYDKQGWRQMLDDMREIPDGTPLYTHPQPKREPLTDEQIVQVLGNVREQLTGNVFLAFARAIERAHGIGGEE